jgi:hypothetical protein
VLQFIRQEAVVCGANPATDETGFRLEESDFSKVAFITAYDANIDPEVLYNRA